MPKIAIIGAGLIGRLTALTLHRQHNSKGYNITLFDQDAKSGHQSAAYAAAGLLTPLGEAMHCEANIVEMGFASLKLWPEILATLNEYTFFQQEGALMVAHEQDQGDYQRIKRFLNNHYSNHPAQQLNRAQLQVLEPDIGRSFNQALFLPQEGQIGNRKLLIALQRQLEQEQAHWLSECKVNAIDTSDATQPEVHFTDVTRNGLHERSQQSASFDLVIDCRGIGAKKSSQGTSVVKDSSQLDDLRGVRGELIQLYAPNVTIHRPIRLMHPRYQLYIAPKGKGHFVIGATEIESEDTSPVTVRSAMELLTAAYSIHPGFAEANIRQHVSQLRPAFSDNQPQIIHNNHLIQVNGLYRHGFLISPVVLAQVDHLVNDLLTNKPNSSPSPYSHLLPISQQSINLHEHIY